MGNIGPGELLIIALIALLLFGAGRIADIGKGLGQGISNFKKGLKEAEGEGDDDEKDEKKPAAKKKSEDEPKKKPVAKAEKKKVVEDEEDEEESDEKVEKEA